MRTQRPYQMVASKRPRHAVRFPPPQLRRWRVSGRALIPLVALLLLLGCDEKEKSEASSAAPPQAPAVIVVPVDRQPVAQIGRVRRTGGGAGEGGHPCPRHRLPARPAFPGGPIGEGGRPALHHRARALRGRGRGEAGEDRERGSRTDLRKLPGGARAASWCGRMRSRAPRSTSASPSRAWRRQHCPARRPICGWPRSISAIRRSAAQSRAGSAAPAITRGNVVGPDAGVLTVVVRQDPIRATFPVSQRQLLEIRRTFQGQGPEAVRVRRSAAGRLHLRANRPRELH